MNQILIVNMCVAAQDKSVGLQAQEAFAYGTNK